MSEQWELSHGHFPQTVLHKWLTTHSRFMLTATAAVLIGSTYSLGNGYIAWMIPAAAGLSFGKLLFSVRMTIGEKWHAGHTVTLLRLILVSSTIAWFFTTITNKPFAGTSAWIAEINRAAIITFIAGGIFLLLDGLDGYLTRRWAQPGAFGAIFDQEADAFYISFMSTALVIGTGAHWLLLWAGLARYMMVQLQRFLGPVKANARRFSARLLFLANGILLATGPILLLLGKPSAETAIFALSIASFCIVTFSFSTDVRLAWQSNPRRRTAFGFWVARLGSGLVAPLLILNVIVSMGPALAGRRAVDWIKPAWEPVIIFWIAALAVSVGVWQLSKRKYLTIDRFILATVAFGFTAVALGGIIQAMGYLNLGDKFLFIEYLNVAPIFLAEDIPRHLGHTGALGLYIGGPILGLLLTGLVYKAFKIGLQRIGSKLRASVVLVLIAVFFLVAWTRGRVAGYPYFGLVPALPTSEFLVRVWNYHVNWQYDPFLALVEEAPPARSMPALSAHNVVLILVESYGHTVFNRQTDYERLTTRLEKMDTRLSEAGYSAASGFLRATVSGGGSWISDAALSCGVPAKRQRHYLMLLGSKRKCIADSFKLSGHSTALVRPSVKKPFPQVHFFGFDTYWDFHALGYRGPSFGWSPVADQFVLQKTLSLFKEQNPLFLQIALTNSHMMWKEIPPYIPDWEMDGGKRFENLHPIKFTLSRLSPDQPLMREAYEQSLLYELQIIEDYMLRLPENSLILLIGDHQPTRLLGNFKKRLWVPVHIISKNKKLLKPWTQIGASNGLHPKQPGKLLLPFEQFLSKMQTMYSGE